MAAFWQGIGGALLAVIVGLTLSKQGKDMTVLLTLAVCAMVLLVAQSFLQPVIDFLRLLHTDGLLDGQMLSLMLKAVGISLISQIAGVICDDAGFCALGKAVKLLSAAAVLYLCLPMLESLLSIIENIVGGL